VEALAEAPHGVEQEERDAAVEVGRTADLRQQRRRQRRRQRGARQAAQQVRKRLGGKVADVLLWVGEEGRVGGERGGQVREQLAQQVLQQVGGGGEDRLHTGDVLGA